MEAVEAVTRETQPPTIHRIAHIDSEKHGAHMFREILLLFYGPPIKSFFPKKSFAYF